MSSISIDNKVLGLKDVTIMAVTVNFCIRWIPVTACLGASAIFFGYSVIWYFSCH